MKTLLVMAGGTGGHVYPALAVAEFLRDQGVRVVWLGTREGLEARVVPAAGIDLHWMNISGLRGKGVGRHLAMPFILARALIEGLRILRGVRPDALLGMGGFAAGPGAIAGWLLRRPLVIHEANASAGMTNRLLAPLARRILCGFPNTAGLPARAEWTGNPIRAGIQPRTPDTDADRALRLLVVGGSLGARVFNRSLPAMLAQLIAEGALEVRHQCGRGNAAEVRDSYGAAGVEACIDEFIEDMGAAYRQADIVICRAGAMTVAELCLAGVPAILVPFPFAAGDHQTANARYLADRDAGILVPQSRLEKTLIVDTLRGFAADRAKLAAMSARARELGRADATEKVGGICLEVMHA